MKWHIYLIIVVLIFFVSIVYANQDLIDSVGAESDPWFRSSGIVLDENGSFTLDGCITFNDNSVLCNSSSLNITGIVGNFSGYWVLNGSEIYREGNVKVYGNFTVTDTAFFSNQTVYIGGVKISEDPYGGLNISKNVTSPYYYGSARYLTDINYTNATFAEVALGTICLSTEYMTGNGTCINATYTCNDVVGCVEDAYNSCGDVSGCTTIAGSTTCAAGELILGDGTCVAQGAGSIWINQSGIAYYPGSVNISGHTWTENLSVSNKLYLEAEHGGSHYIVVGSDDVNGAPHAITFDNNDPQMFEGQITFLFMSTENITNAWMQYGMNGSYGGWGNSFGLVPNSMGIQYFADGTGKVNMTKLSNYPFLCEYFGVDCKYDADTGGRARYSQNGTWIPGGPLLWTMGDLEIWGESKLHEGAEIEKSFVYIGDGVGDIDFYNEPLHLKIPRLENVTFGIGDIELFEITWNGEPTGLQPPPPFIETGDGLGTINQEWSTRTDFRCYSDPCARAKGGLTGAIRGMDHNFSTLNVSLMMLSFWYGSKGMDIGPADNFSVFMNNNEGSGWVLIYEDIITNSDINPAIFKNFSVPSSMDNKSIVSLRFNHYATGNNEESYVDSVKINGTVGSPIVIEITRNDARIELGGSTFSNVQCEIYYNDSSKTIEIGRDPNCQVIVYNSTFTQINVGSQNITGDVSITGCIFMNDGTIYCENEINASTELVINSNVTAEYYKGDGSLLENIVFVSQIYEDEMNITITGGNGSGTFSNNFTAYPSEVLQLSVFPITNTSNKYRFQANKTTDGEIVDRDRQEHEGDWIVSHRGTTIFEDSVSFSIIDVVDDGNFTVKVRYRT